jgi:hypothetical protein
VPHVDEGEWATTRLHKTHQCQSCGHEWRPFSFATVGIAHPAPVVPVWSADTLPPISLDGPHKIGEHRQWLARQLLDSRQDDAEAYSTVIYSPAMTDIWRDGVVPVGREEIAEILKDEVLTDGGIIMSSEPSSRRRLRIADRILAALRPTYTGGKA